MTRTFFTDNATLMSPRTAKYVEAMIREGDNFDYNKWLKEVREEEAQAKQAPAVSTTGEPFAARMDVPIKTFDDQHPRPNLALPLTAKATPARTLRRLHRQAESQTPKAQLRRRLEKVRRAWEDFQASRKRDSVYGFLETVFAIVEHFRIRRRTKRLLRHAFKFADLPAQKTDPFAAVIRCTSDRDIDSKTVSKWARALRYRSFKGDRHWTTAVYVEKGWRQCVYQPVRKIFRTRSPT